MKFNKKLIREGLNSVGPAKKVFTAGRKQNVVLTEDQLDRLLLQLKESREKSIELIIRESHNLIRKAIINERLKLNIDNYSDTLMEQGQYDRNPGIAAAEGLENILNGIKKAYEMIKDSDTRKRLANSITKLGNFMTITADAIASGRDQRAPRTSDSLKDPLPYPELDEQVSDEFDEQTTAASAGAYVAPLEFTEDSEGEETYNYGEDEGHDDKELYDLRHDGGSEDHIHDLEDDMKYDEDHEDRDEKDTHFESMKKRNKLIREDIKKMKQVIHPIKKVSPLVNEQLDFSWEGITNIPGYWAEKIGVDSDDIDISIEGVKNIPNWWSDKVNDVIKSKIAQDAGKTEENDLIDDIADTLEDMDLRLPSKKEVVDFVKKYYCPWC